MTKIALEYGIMSRLSGMSGLSGMFMQLAW